jgi:mRNA export factor
MTFKCHKTEENNNVNILYPVHSIGFHPNSKNFVFTAGGDGTMTFWDYEQKNKIKTFNFKGVPVTKAKVSHDGQAIAYALGYDWQKGIWGIDPNIKPKVCVHMIAENELKYSGPGYSKF